MHWLELNDVVSTSIGTEKKNADKMWLIVMNFESKFLPFVMLHQGMNIFYIFYLVFLVIRKKVMKCHFVDR